VSLKVSSIRHVANIDVTLEGTVGAAATGVEIVPLSAIFDQPEEVLVDKPFIFLVKDTQLDTIIFCGKITNPNS
jgi:serpin B